MRSAVAAISLTLLATPASADWQYTKWGMTTEQVSAASKGQMKRCGAACDKQTTPTETALLYAPYQSGKFPFTAFAFFNNQTKKLAFVSLRLDDPTMGFELVGALKGKYGQPESKSATQVMNLYVWRSGGDQIDVTLIGSSPNDTSTTLSYRPRMNSSNKGL